MTVLPNLFGEWTLQREWGRVGQGGQVRLDLFRSKAEAERALNTLEDFKQRRAYEQVNYNQPMCKQPVDTCKLIGCTSE
jgi:predicted DNA-binding WGR domain protein